MTGTVTVKPNTGISIVNFASDFKRAIMVSTRPLLLALALLVVPAWGFVTTNPRAPIPFLQGKLIRPSSVLQAVGEGSFVDGIAEKLQSSLRIAQESNAKGYNFKQTLANVLAGDYDRAAVQVQINDAIASAPCVMFTWERSPSCVKAIEALELMGIANQVKIVRLDDPWDQGNPIRAELGLQVGRTSVPAIFIGGEYVGGFDGGVSDVAPGIQSMAFQGTLRPRLEKAGLKLS